MAALWGGCRRLPEATQEPEFTYDAAIRRQSRSEHRSTNMSWAISGSSLPAPKIFGGYQFIELQPYEAAPLQQARFVLVVVLVLESGRAE